MWSWLWLRRPSTLHEGLSGSYMICSVTSVKSDSLWPYTLLPARVLCSWDSPGKNTGMGCHFLLQGIFLTQGSNPHLLCLLHCRQMLYRLSYQAKQMIETRYHLELKESINWDGASLIAQWSRIHLQCKRCRFDPWVGKVPERRKWLPTLVFLPGEFQGQRNLAS